MVGNGNAVSGSSATDRAGTKGEQTTKTTPSSYRNLTPLEEGGRLAREGFDYQDHIAASKCLDMMHGIGPVEVWCEAEDDVVLVWRQGDRECFEFVQVKSNDLSQAWTVAKLCGREAGKEGTKKWSIVEKSLAHDRGLEQCRFRLVTKWEPDKTLNVLKVDLENRDDPSTIQQLREVTTAIVRDVGGFTSSNGNGVDFWVKNVVWEVHATPGDVKNSNLLSLERLLEKEGISLAPDQRAELYLALYSRIQDASLANAKVNRNAKRLMRENLLSWLRKKADGILHPTHSGRSETLQRKLREAEVDGTSIEAAKVIRGKYLKEVRTPKYLTLDDREAYESEAFARLHTLKTQLEAGELRDTGREFLNRCQKELRNLRDELEGMKPSESLLYGYMYEVMNRCLHRLVKASE